MSLKPDLYDLNFLFDGGVLCVVTDRERSESNLFSLITEELTPNSGNIQSDIQSISLCTNGLPCEVKVKDYLKFVLKCKKYSSMPQISHELSAGLQNRYIGSLTELEKVKISAAAALIGEPSLLLLCAPAKSIKPSEAATLGALIDKLREHINIIYSCNMPSLFGKHSDKLLVISEGKELIFADTEEVLELAKKEGTLSAKIKGNIDSAAKSLGGEYSFENSDKQGVFNVYCTDSKNARKELRETVRKLGMAILSIKADNDALKDFLSGLVQKEETAVLSEEEHSYEEAHYDEYISDESHTYIYEDTEEQEEHSSNTKPKRRISIAFAHNDEEDAEE